VPWKNQLSAELRPLPANTAFTHGMLSAITLRADSGSE
jgi:hypothetical protein